MKAEKNEHIIGIKRPGLILPILKIMVYIQFSNAMGYLANI